MARPLRIEFPGAIYHVTSRGNERKAVFKTQRDREKFLSYLESATERYEAVIAASEVVVRSCPGADVRPPAIASLFPVSASWTERAY